MKVAWRATELDPDYLEAHDLVGNALFRIGDYERSLLAYRRVVRIDADDAQGHYNIGLAYWSMGKYDEAERSWQKAIQKDRKAKKAKLDKSSEPDELVHSLTVETSPVSFDAHKSLGALYDSMGKKEKALLGFEAALEFVPNDSECYYYLGKIYYEKGDMEKAISHLEKCVYLGTKWEKKATEILERIRKDSDERKFVLQFGNLN
jgi:tetratricopeptide (TPR) repeat protein